MGGSNGGAMVATTPFSILLMQVTYCPYHFLLRWMNHNRLTGGCPAVPDVIGLNRLRILLKYLQ